MPEHTSQARSPGDHQKNKKYIFKTDPWAHQLEALKRSWDKTFFALLCDYGTGKTKIVIDNAAILYEYNLITALMVIAPNGVHEDWIIDHVPKHLPDRIAHIDRSWTGSTSQKFKASLEEFWEPRNTNKLKIFTINVEALQTSSRARAFCKNFLLAFPSFLAVDESTRIKTPSAKRAKFVVNTLGKLAQYRRTMTGNEITRSPFDVYMPYLFLDQNFWHPIPNFHVFKHRYGEWKTGYTYRKSVKVDLTCSFCSEDISEIKLKRLSDRLFPVCPLCSKVIPVEEVPGKARKIINDNGKFEYPTLINYKNLEELRARTRECSYIIKAEECQDLPPKIYKPIYTQMNEEQIQVYKELKTKLITEYKGTELTVTHKIALSVRFQQIVGGFFPETEEPLGDTNPKIERLLYDLEDVDCPDPLIIWAVFKPELRALYSALRKEYNAPVALYYGETPKPERLRIREDFQAGKYKFLVANPSTAGTGLNLQRAYIQYFFSNSNNAEDRWQSEKRTHRGEQTKTCFYKDVFIRGTIDDTIRKANEEKKALAEFFREKPLEKLF